MCVRRLENKLVRTEKIMSYAEMISDLILIKKS